MSKPLFIYQCPVCRTINKVCADEIYHTTLKNVGYVCPVCKRKEILVYDSYYWEDHKPHLSKEINIMYYDDYLRELSRLKQ